jgi:hypothetical protein
MAKREETRFIRSQLLARHLLIKQRRDIGNQIRAILLALVCKSASYQLGHKSESTTDQHYRNHIQMICDSLKLHQDIKSFLRVAH